MISLKLKVLDVRETGCDVWMTIFEVTDETGVEPVLPQHFILYNEGKPDLNPGDRTSLHLRENKENKDTKASNADAGIVCKTCDKPFSQHYLDHQADGVGDWNWHIIGGSYLPIHDIVLIKRDQ